MTYSKSHLPTHRATWPVVVLKSEMLRSKGRRPVSKSVPAAKSTPEAKTAVATTDDDSSSSLAPDTTDTTNSLTDGYNANNTITGYCHSLLNTALTWDTSTQGPIPDWFATLQTSLTTAQGHANIWLTGTTTNGTTVPPLGPTVFSTVPQSIINYGNTFTNATNDILAITNSVPPGGSLTQAQITTINEYLTALLEDLGVQQATLTSVQTQLVAFANDVQTDYNNFNTGQNSAQQALAIEEQDMVTIQAQINLVTSQIQTDSQAALASEIGLGVGIFICVVGIAAAVATGGATLALVGVGIAVLAVGGAIAGTVIFSQKVNDDLNKLYQLQDELSDDQKQVTAITAISNSVSTLITANESAQTAISDTLNMWSVLEGKLNSVITDLEQAEADEAMAILEGLDIQNAQTAWAQLVTFATQIQTNNITVQPTVNQPGVTMPSSSSSSNAA